MLFGVPSGENEVGDAPTLAGVAVGNVQQLFEGETDAMFRKVRPSTLRHPTALVYAHAHRRRGPEWHRDNVQQPIVRHLRPSPMALLY